MNDNQIELHVTLDPVRAHALAQFAKRAIFDTFRDRATSEDEAYAMRDALYAVGEALAAAGFAPR
jgi:hypothetical protein